MVATAVSTRRLDETITEFEGTLRGSLVRTDDEVYDDARTVWNATVDKHPALIVQCAGTADVISAVAFAKEHGFPISVKGGGHNIAGRAVEDDALMIDLSPMKSVRVDPDAKTARVEPGVVLNELDRETQAFGLATPVGYNSTTGIAGLTLGGGWGWLSRTYGLTVDNLISADVVTAEGELVHASEDENEDLFWGIRGGGGNFGVVTSFEFELHEVGPTVLSGPSATYQDGACKHQRRVEMALGQRDVPDLDEETDVEMMIATREQYRGLGDSTVEHRPADDAVVVTDGGVATETATQGNEETLITGPHLELPEQGGATYYRCENCGRESLRRGDVEHSEFHAEECALR